MLLKHICICLSPVSKQQMCIIYETGIESSEFYSWSRRERTGLLFGHEDLKSITSVHGEASHRGIKKLSRATTRSCFYPTLYTVGWNVAEHFSSVCVSIMCRDVAARCRHQRTISELKVSGHIKLNKYISTWPNGMILQRNTLLKPYRHTSS